MRAEALRVWRGHSREDAARAAGVGIHVIRQYERRPLRVRSRGDRRKARRYYATLAALQVMEVGLSAMVATLSAPDEEAPSSAA